MTKTFRLKESIRARLTGLHARMGDFWWYSLMIFCACRAADLLNAFVGLWLVPRYIAPSELGAVVPLANFANVLAIPAAAFAAAFRNEVSRLSAGREFGRLRTLMRGVFAAAAVFLFLATVAARLAMPLFLERIRVAEGSLALVIIAASFAAAVAPVYTNALQALKKFREISFMNVAGAPVRLLTMLAAMPYRALTGYFVGQAATPAFCIAASVLGLRRELSADPEPYWNRETIRKFSGLFAIFLSTGAVGGMFCLVEATVIRQRLPDLDSAGYYMATRFSEIASYLFSAIGVTLFPLAADLAERHDERRRLVLRALLANCAFCALAGGAFWAFGRQALALLPHGDEYSAYWWAVPWLAAIAAVGSVQGFYTTAETAAGRFGYLKWLLPIDIAYPLLLLLVTGYGYYASFLPQGWAAFLEHHNIRSLGTMLWWMTAVNAVKAAICLVSMSRRGKE